MPKRVPVRSGGRRVFGVVIVVVGVVMVSCCTARIVEGMFLLRRKFRDRDLPN